MSTTANPTKKSRPVSLVTRVPFERSMSQPSRRQPPQALTGRYNKRASINMVQGLLAKITIKEMNSILTPTYLEPTTPPAGPTPESEPLPISYQHRGNNQAAYSVPSFDFSFRTQAQRDLPPSPIESIPPPIASSSSSKASDLGWEPSSVVSLRSTYSPTRDWNALVEPYQPPPVSYPSSAATNITRDPSPVSSLRSTDSPTRDWTSSLSSMTSDIIAPEDLCTCPGHTATLPEGDESSSSSDIPSRKSSRRFRKVKRTSVERGQEPQSRLLNFGSLWGSTRLIENLRTSSDIV